PRIEHALCRPGDLFAEASHDLRTVLAGADDHPDRPALGPLYDRPDHGPRPGGHAGQSRTERDPAIALAAAADGGSHQFGGKPRPVRAARHHPSPVGHLQWPHDHGLRALLLGAACSRGHLCVGRSGVPHVELPGILGRPDHPGAGDLPHRLRRCAAHGSPRAGAAIAHGNIATWPRPKVSGKPSITFMFWIAWPDAPLVRLSSAATIMARPGTRSATTPMNVMFDPRTCRVCGTWPSGSTCTKASLP